VARAHGVAREGALGIALGAVDGVVGGSVHDLVGLHGVERVPDRGEIHDVELGPRPRDDLVAAPPVLDRPPELPAGPGEQDSHASKSS
jgi:hypothetical protein